MTQSSLFQYILPTAGPDAHPLYQMTSREWRDRIAAAGIPHAIKSPRVEISNENFHPPGAETPHLLITVYPDRRYLALTAEVREVRGGTRDICKVVSAPKGDEYAAG